MEVTTSDYIRASYISNFEQEYEALAMGEIVDTFALDKEKAPSLKGKKKYNYNQTMTDHVDLFLF